MQPTLDTLSECIGGHWRRRLCLLPVVRLRSMVRAVRAGVVLALLLAGGAVMGAAATGESAPFRTSGSLFSASVAEEVSRVVYGPVLTKARLLVSGPVGNGF